MKTLLQEGFEKNSDPIQDQSRIVSRSINRQPSLADIPTITSNCCTSSILPKEKDSIMDSQSKSSVLDSDIARTENSIALIAAQSQCNEQQPMSQIPITPPKITNDQATNIQNNSSDEPLTPTANLKMLVSAASPAIRDRESKKRELFTDSGDSEPPSPSNPCVVPSFALPIFESKVVYRNGNFVHINTHDGSEKLAISRKDKSLGLLCQRFLAKYPENPLPDEKIEISLDEVAKDLKVERRRIYDIVNVLESVEVISRFAKNRYMWHGKTKLPQTLAKLKHYAESHGFTNKGIADKENPNKYLDKMSSAGNNNSSNKYIKNGKNKVDKLPHLLPKNTKGFLTGMGYLSGVFDNDDDDSWARKQKEAEYCRKDKSLGVLSQKFLMMFLVSESRQVILDDAANVLIDEQEEGKAKYKTKVRRLYDIANILSSLQLIQKVHIHNIQSGRKPGFRWIGIDLDKLESQFTQKQPLNDKPVKAKNSLVQKEFKQESAFGRLISRRPSQQQMRRNKSDKSLKSKMPRSRSDRALTTKKRVLSSDSENTKSSEEDGYSVQEISDLKETSTMRSPDSVKFHSELMKLKEQYPNRMQQLLSACTSLQSPPEDRKSRRTLFVSEAYADAPLPKRRRSTEDLEESCMFRAKDASYTSTETKNEFCKIQELKQGSPEQKILLERKKQNELLAEQRNFQFEDERWQRIEKELDKAIPKAEPMKKASPDVFDNFHPSVGIQASLIADISPLKPLSHCVQNIPISNILNSIQQPDVNKTSVSGHNVAISPLVSNAVNASAVQLQVKNISPKNIKVMSIPQGTKPSVWKMSPCSRTQGNQQIFFTVPQQQSGSPVITKSQSPAYQGQLQSTGEGEGSCFGNVMQPKTIQSHSVSLPLDIVNSLNLQGLIHKTVPCAQENQGSRPFASMQPAKVFTPRIGHNGTQSLQVTPILPKVAPQQLFTPISSSTPGSSTTFLHPEIAKKLVMPDSNAPQS